MLVCIAPDVATLHISELFTTTLGAFAVGTDLSVTTVELTVFVSAPNAEFIMLFKKKINIVARTIPITDGFNIAHPVIFYLLVHLLQELQMNKLIFLRF